MLATDVDMSDITVEWERRVVLFLKSYFGVEALEVL